MRLKLTFLTCMLCNSDLCLARERARLDDLDADGLLDNFPMALPSARHRDRIAPELCDLCWKDFRWKHRHALRGYTKDDYPFRQIYLWAWVAYEFEKMATEYRQQRLVPHLQEKAIHGNGNKLAGSRRLDRRRRLEQNHAQGNWSVARYLSELT